MPPEPRTSQISLSSQLQLKFRSCGRPGRDVPVPRRRHKRRPRRPWPGASALEALSFQTFSFRQCSLRFRLLQVASSRFVFVCVGFSAISGPCYSAWVLRAGQNHGFQPPPDGNEP